MTRRTLALALAVGLAGCEAPLTDEVGPARSTEPVTFAPLTSAMPARVHFLERAGERCVLYVVDAGERTLGDAVACPRALSDGERMRLAGRSCFRESSDPSRRGPVGCAPALFDAARPADSGAASSP